jgi:hypothetical protein
MTRVMVWFLVYALSVIAFKSAICASEVVLNEVKGTKVGQGVLRPPRPEILPDSLRSYGTGRSSTGAHSATLRVNGTLSE